MNGMESLDLDRLRTLYRIFVEGPGPDLKELAAAADISPRVLAPGYGSTPGAATVEKIARGAAKLLNLDRSQLLAWLYGEDEPIMEAYLGQLLHLRRCTGCLGWFEEKEMVARLSRCKKCVRDTGFQRRLQQKPELAKYYEELRERLPEAKKKDPELAHLVAQALAAGRAVKRSKLAEELGGLSRYQMWNRWLKAGLVGGAMSIGGAGQAQARELPPIEARAPAPSPDNAAVDIIYSGGRRSRRRKAADGGASDEAPQAEGRPRGRTAGPIASGGGRRRRAGPRPAEAAGAEHRASQPDTQTGALRETGAAELRAAGVCHG